MSLFKKSNAQFAPPVLLVASLLFTLSGHSPSGNFSGELTLASQNCDYVDALHHSENGADCNFRQTIDGLEVRSHVTVTRDTRVVQDFLAPATTPAVSETMLKVNLKLETDCDEDCQDHKRPTSELFYLQMSDLKNISQIISDHLKSDGKELAQEEAAARKKVADERRRRVAIENCEVKEDGTKIEGNSQLNCLAGRMAEIKDEDKAADFYEKNIMSKVKALVGSDDEAKRKLGMAILEKVNEAGHGGNFVKESIADISMFGGAKSKAFELQKQMVALNSLPLNDPRRAQIATLAQQARIADTYADSYFGNQKTKETYEPFSANLGFDPSSMLLQSNTAMQQMLDAQYANIIAQQRTGLAASNLPGQGNQFTQPGHVPQLPAANQLAQLNQNGQYSPTGNLPPPPQVPNTPAALAAAKKQGLPAVTQPANP